MLVDDDDQRLDADGLGRRLVEIPRGAAAALVALTGFVCLPLVGLALRADERFYPYMFGVDRTRQPSSIVTYPIEVIPLYLEFGNFRPIGRILEHANYYVQYQLFRVTGLPMHVVLGIVRVVSVMLLGLTVLWFVRRLQAPRLEVAAARSHDGLAWLTVLIFPALITYSSGRSSLVVFAGLYLQSVALMLLLAAPFTAAGLYGDQPIAPRKLVGFGLLGVVAAATNELVYLAVPVAAAIVVTRAWQHRLRPAELLRSSAGRASLASAFGFLVVFVPARIAIARSCRPDASRACYDASEVTFADWTPALWLARALAGLPVHTWVEPRLRGVLLSVAPRVAVALLIVIAATWLGTGSRRPTVDDEDGQAANGAFAVGATLVLAGGLLSSLSAGVQDGMDPYASWRDAPVAFAGWTLVLAGVAHRVASRLRWHLAVALVLALATSVGIATTFASNVARQQTEDNRPELSIANRIAVEAASFVRSPEADQRRCELLDEFAATHPPSQTERLQRAVDATSNDRYGTDFCLGDARD